MVWWYIYIHDTRVLSACMLFVRKERLEVGVKHIHYERAVSGDLLRISYWYDLLTLLVIIYDTTDCTSAAVLAAEHGRMPA